MIRDCQLIKKVLKGLEKADGLLCVQSLKWQSVRAEKASFFD